MARLEACRSDDVMGRSEVSAGATRARGRGWNTRDYARARAFEIVNSSDFKRNVVVLSSKRARWRVGAGGGPAETAAGERRRRRARERAVGFILIYVPVRAYFSWRFRRLPMAVNINGRMTSSMCMFSRSVMVMYPRETRETPYAAKAPA